MPAIRLCGLARLFEIGILSVANDAGLSLTMLPLESSHHFFDQLYPLRVARLAETPARRRDPIGGEEGEELHVRGRAGRVRPEPVELIHLVHVRLGDDVEGGQQVSVRGRRCRKPDVEDADRHRDRGRLPVGRDRDDRAVAAGLRVGRNRHLEVERLVRSLGRARRAAPGEERVRDVAAAEGDEVAEVDLRLQRPERAAVDGRGDGLRVRGDEPGTLPLPDRRVEGERRGAALGKPAARRDRLCGGEGEDARARGRGRGARASDRYEQQAGGDHGEPSDERHLTFLSTAPCAYSTPKRRQASPGRRARRGRARAGRDPSPAPAR